MIREQKTFDSWDLLQAFIQPWDLSRFVFTDRGQAFNGRVDLALAEHFYILRTRFDRSFLQAGASPPGYRSFGFLSSESTTASFGGSDLKNGIASFDGNEFEAVSQGGFDGWIVGFDERFLTELGREDRSLISCRHSEGTLVCDENMLTRLRNLAAIVLGGSDESSDMTERAMAVSLLEGFEHAVVETAVQKSLRPTTRVRRRALNRALEFIEENLHRNLTIREICGYAAVSERTLQYAFREYCGVTPKFYLNSRRLHAVRDAFKNEEGSAGVAEIANRYEFWHMGKLAGDYRRLFGELPSETRHRGSRGAAIRADF